MYRYFIARNTRRYVDVLPDLLHSYNHTYHRSIGMAPVEVDDTNRTSGQGSIVSPKTKIIQVEV